MKGQEEWVVAIAFLIAGITILVIVARVGDPLRNPEVKAVQLANDVSSFLNTLYLQDGGSVSFPLEEAFDVKVEFRDGMYFAGAKWIKGKEFKEAPILFYPSTKVGYLEKFFPEVKEVCLTKDVGKEFPEVVEC